MALFLMTSYEINQYSLLGSLPRDIKVRTLPIRQRTCEANAVGENSTFIFTVCVRSVSCYHFKLACVVLQMAVKEFFETDF